MGVFDAPEGMPRIEHAIVDEETQMQRYLAEVAMEDILLSPPPNARKIRPGSLAEAYQQRSLDEHAREAANDAAPVSDVMEIITSEVRPAVPQQTEPTGGWHGNGAREFKGE